jgi:hypothetical protein
MHVDSDQQLVAFLNELDADAVSAAEVTNRWRRDETEIVDSVAALFRQSCVLIGQRALEGCKRKSVQGPEGKS